MTSTVLVVNYRIRTNSRWPEKDRIGLSYSPGEVGRHFVRSWLRKFTSDFSGTPAVLAFSTHLPCGFAAVSSLAHTYTSRKGSKMCRGRCIFCPLGTIGRESAEISLNFQSLDRMGAAALVAAEVRGPQRLTFCSIAPSRLGRLSVNYEWLAAGWPR